MTTKTKRKSVTTPPPFALINLNPIFGPPMAYAELAGALAGQEENPAVRAMMQVLCFELQLARGHEEMPAVQPGERDYGAGAASSVNSGIRNLTLLVTRKFEAGELGALRAQFGAQKSEASNPEAGGQIS